MSDTEKAAQHYSDQLKAALFAEVIQALRGILDAGTHEQLMGSYENARVVLEKIDSNELLKG